MKTVVPSWYLKFRCIAGACRHSCCAEGWEIGIDDEHQKFYKKLSETETGALKEQIRQGIFLPTVKERREGLRPHILLKEDGRCPFLTEKNLCSLILAYGENAICQICTDHPRFRNFYPDRIELGAGLCCEEACRLLLNAEHPEIYVELKTGEAVPARHQMSGKKKELQYLEKKKLDFSDWAVYLLGLEMLEPGWAGMLEALKEDKDPGGLPEEEETELCKALCRIREYLMFRHAEKEGSAFVSFSERMLTEMICRRGILPELTGTERTAEILRLFSSEIEYSEEGMEAVIKKLQEDHYCII